QLEVRVEQMEHMQNTIASMEKNELPILTYISTSSGLLSFSTENIIYIKGISQGCVEIVVKDDNRKLVVTAALKDYEIALKPFTRFVRVHRSCIVNLFQMRKYNRGDKPSLEMIDGKLIPVSKTYKSQLVQKMGQLGMRL
ncbi:MAG: LytTR family DNA-binding domain-containing protein, partial [Bacteroidota bacterium]